MSKKAERDALKAEATARGLDFPDNVPTAKLKEMVAGDGTQETSGAGAQTSPGMAASDAGGGAEGTSPPVQPVAPAVDGTVMTVTGPKRGRWRAGRHFTAVPVTIALVDLTLGDGVAISLDPKLTVTVAEADTKE